MSEGGNFFLKKSDDHWMSISDIMSGLMIVFMFIAVAFMLQLQNKITEYTDAKNKIYNALYEEFKNDLPKWNAEIDEKTLTFRFKEPDILFLVGSDNLTWQFQQILNDFLPRYIKIISQDEYKDYIEEIRIEGHTDPFWAGATSRQEEYLNNMKLSQSRTQAVLSYAINMPALQNNLEWIIQKVTANGLSSSQPIKINGIVNAELSRRVDFRIRTTSEKIIKNLEGNDKN